MRFIVYGTYTSSLLFFLCAACSSFARIVSDEETKRRKKNRNRFNRTNSQTNIYLIPFIMHIIRIYFIWSFFFFCIIIFINMLWLVRWVFGLCFFFLVVVAAAAATAETHLG